MYVSLDFLLLFLILGRLLILMILFESYQVKLRRFESFSIYNNMQLNQLFSYLEEFLDNALYPSSELKLGREQPKVR